MFTGLIEARGTLESISPSGLIKIKTDLARELKIGDSIASNGVCLTVTSCDEISFTADVMPVTLGNTNLGSLKIGSYINLERAMGIKDRFDGHIVTGHVDGIGRIKSIENEGNAVLYTIGVENSVIKRLIDKGSIAIDGISLTIQALLKDCIVVSIIPHTNEVTTLSNIKIGEPVNIESDVIGKYVERLLGINKSNVTTDLLSRCGFL